MFQGSPFQHRDFRLLLTGQTAAQLGAQISGVAIPLLAVLTLQATPWQLGLLTASGTLAFALIGLPAGACCCAISGISPIVSQRPAAGIDTLASTRGQVAAVVFLKP